MEPIKKIKKASLGKGKKSHDGKEVYDLAGGSGYNRNSIDSNM